MNVNSLYRFSVAATALICFVFLATLSGCEDKKDSWFRPAPSEFYASSDRLQLPVDSIFVPKNEDVAISELEKRSYKILSQHDLSMLLGKASRVPNGKFAVLVRGLTYDTKGEGFSVFEKGSSILVENSLLTRGHPTMIRKPLVVFADSSPTEIYVTCSIVE